MQDGCFLSARCGPKELIAGLSSIIWDSGRWRAASDGVARSGSSS